MEHGASARRRPVVGCSVVIDPKHDSCTKRAGVGFTKELGVAGFVGLPSRGNYAAHR